jgi:hypothetical protein
LSACLSVWPANDAPNSCIATARFDALKPAGGDQLFGEGESAFSISEGSGAVLLYLSEPYCLARPPVDDEIKESLGGCRVGIGRHNDGPQQGASWDRVEWLVLFRRLD